MAKPKNPKFTKGNYGLVAAIMRSVKPPMVGSANDVIRMMQWEQTCLAFLNHFKQDNPAFDRDRFLDACKGE